MTSKFPCKSPFPCFLLNQSNSFKNLFLVSVSPASRSTAFLFESECKGRAFRRNRKMFEKFFFEESRVFFFNGGQTEPYHYYIEEEGNSKMGIR